MSVPVLDNARARSLFLARHGLGGVVSGPGKGPDLADVIGDLGFVQLDSVNTFARAHDLILWARRGQYRPTALGHLLTRDRAVFEHWTHDAAAIPMDFFPHWNLRFARDEALLAGKWQEWRRKGFMEKIDDILRHVADHGCCTSADVGGDEPKGSGGWWDWHPSKTALEYLWRTGHLSISRRDGFRKVYDLTERVIPDNVRHIRPDVAESVDWLCAAALDRLGFATSGELAAFWATVTPAEAADWVRDGLAAGRLMAVDVAGADGKRRRSVAWPGIMEEVPAPLPGKVRILSPFDPALRDRKRAERLFGFFYRIEIFVPAPQRQYGYYVFPVMEGDSLIGRIDMKRTGEVLAVRAFWPEQGLRMGTGRIARLRAELARAARFGGCSDITFAPDWMRSPM